MTTKPSLLLHALVAEHTENLFNEAARRFGGHRFNDPPNPGDETRLRLAQMDLACLLSDSYGRDPQ